MVRICGLEFEVWGFGVSLEFRVLGFQLFRNLIGVYNLWFLGSGMYLGDLGFQSLSA